MMEMANARLEQAQHALDFKEEGMKKLEGVMNQLSLLSQVGEAVAEVSSSQCCI